MTYCRNRKVAERLAAQCPGAKVIPAIVKNFRFAVVYPFKETVHG